jgi:hypothetical protein
LQGQRSGSHHGARRGQTKRTENGTGDRPPVAADRLGVCNGRRQWATSGVHSRPLDPIEFRAQGGGVLIVAARSFGL